MNNNIEKVWELKRLWNHNDSPLKFGLLWLHFSPFWSDFSNASCTFGATPLLKLRKSLKYTTKRRHITELFHFLQRGDTNHLEGYDQKCGKLFHNRPNFKRLSLCLKRLNLNETFFRRPLRSLRAKKTFEFFWVRRQKCIGGMKVRPKVYGTC